MRAKFITHPEFEELTPINTYHKEYPKIAHNHPAEYLNKHILFRKKFILPDNNKATVKITADDYYKLYINGKFVAAGPAPSYNRSYYYNEIDVSDYLKIGENTIAVHTYYQGLINHVWVSADLRHMLWLSLSVGGEEVLYSDNDWLCHYHTGYTECGTFGYDTAFAEQYDSASREDGFMHCDFNDSYWHNAVINRTSDYTLRCQPTKNVEFYQITPEVIEHREGYIFIDLLQEMAGSLVIEASGKVGDKIILRYGEELLENGRVRYDMRCNCLYEEKWFLSGNNCDILRQFDYKAFRYAEIIYPENVEIHDVKMEVRHYPIEIKNNPIHENAKINEILNLCKNTIIYGTQELFVDCPTREKGQYIGDVCISAKAYTVLSGNTVPIKKAITDFFDSVFICPGFMAVAPSGLMQEIADYSLLVPALVNWVYKVDGDIDFLRSAEPYLEAAYQYFLKYQRSDGLLDSIIDKWNLVDWPENLRDGYDFPLTRPVGPGTHNVINAFWCGFLDAMDEYYSLIGKKKVSIAKKTKDAFVKAFYSEKNGLFCDSENTEHSAVHSNILPLLFEIGTEDHPDLTSRIISLIEKKGLHSMGVYMAYFALCALKKAGAHDIAIKLATDDRAWMNMIREGATTTFEAWGKDQKSNCSLFHPWATCPIIVFQDKYPIY